MKNILPKSALVSLSDKTNLDLLVSFLVEKNVEIISTGGTYNYLKSHIHHDYHNRIISIENYTEFPEILQGRVKTLHPKIYGGILYDENINDLGIYPGTFTLHKKF